MEAIAALIDAAVTLVPLLTVLQADVAHCVRVVEIVAPAFDQFVARLGERRPVQSCCE
ncbi:hypothetical protein [Terracidiphilus gabretensis]|jgi:heme/copper-type cytochrome/quinol oxidase subunit 4|uniref:hypothetical protein n=1 Tax=Terracidiphilus gabretensis TaxID=1577687 RepID=UPI0018D24EC0|nr:hypothetical protein [Terracidiphilus gabretensis]